MLQRNNISSTESVWGKIKTSSFRAVKKNLTADVCIMGSGITGLTAAYLLSKAGKKVIVIDKGGIADGETAYTTAHLTYVLDDKYFELEKIHGPDKIRLVLKSHSDAIDRIEDICVKEKIDCDFARVDGDLFLSGNDDKKGEEILDLELQTMKKLGRNDVKKIDEKTKENSLGTHLRFPKQAQFHPLKYLSGLIKIIQKHGGEIYEKSQAKDIQEDHEGVVVELENGCTIRAETAVIATHVPFNDRFKMHLKQAAYRTYVIAGEIPKNSVEKSLYWDTEAPYHYIRLVNKSSAGAQDFLMVGGEDHKTGQDDECGEKFQNLREWTQKNFPMMKRASLQWSGQIIQTMDGLAFIGLNPGNKRIYIGTGYSGSGMTYGTIAGSMLTDLIFGKENSLAQLYHPARKTVKALGRFMKESINVAEQYAGGMATGSDVTLKDLTPGSGIVVAEGLKKIAVYKEKTGKICKFSAVCPHLGCIVKWNNAESTWDCPCHGSRFEAHGKVLNGPAPTDLETL